MQFHMLLLCVVGYVGYVVLPFIVTASVAYHALSPLLRNFGIQGLHNAAATIVYRKETKMTQKKAHTLGCTFSYT